MIAQSNLHQWLVTVLRDLTTAVSQAIPNVGGLNNRYLLLHANLQLPGGWLIWAGFCLAGSAPKVSHPQARSYGIADPQGGKQKHPNLLRLRFWLLPWHICPHPLTKGYYMPQFKDKGVAIYILHLYEGTPKSHDKRYDTGRNENLELIMHFSRITISENVENLTTEK